MTHQADAAVARTGGTEPEGRSDEPATRVSESSSSSFSVGETTDPTRGTGETVHGARVDYPCGCGASGGLLPLPASCPIHGARGTGEHSPLPWHVKGHGHVIAGADGKGVAMTRDDEPRGAADAVYIVQAVNSHDALLAALRELIEKWQNGSDSKVGDVSLITEADRCIAAMCAAELAGVGGGEN